MHSLKAEPYEYSASEALLLVMRNKLSIEHYIQSLLSRIELRDSQVNAWAYLDKQAVLEEARKLDRLPIAARGPLHGLIVAVKDVILTKGTLAWPHGLYLFSPLALNIASCRSMLIKRHSPNLLRHAHWLQLGHLHR